MQLNFIGVTENGFEKLLASVKVEQGEKGPTFGVWSGSCAAGIEIVRNNDSILLDPMKLPQELTYVRLVLQDS